MFGLLTDTPVEEIGWGRLQRRRVVPVGRFRDVDWAALAAASANLTAGVITAVAKGTQGSAQQNNPATYACPQGYFYHAQTNTCQPIVQNQGGFFSNIDPTTLLIGGGLLAVLLLGRN